MRPHAWPLGRGILIRETDASAFVSCTSKFVGTQPTEALRASVYKVYNLLFRPNLRLADSAVDTGAHLAALFLSLAWWLAAIAVLLTARRVMDWQAGAFVVLFVLPFAFTNSDPRFRLPLDPVYAVSLMRTFGARPRP